MWARVSSRSASAFVPWLQDAAWPFVHPHDWWLFPDSGVCTRSVWIKPHECTRSVWIKPHEKTHIWLREGDLISENLLTHMKHEMVDAWKFNLKVLPLKESSNMACRGLSWSPLQDSDPPSMALIPRFSVIWSIECCPYVVLYLQL
jgi:hypothetical protein